MHRLRLFVLWIDWGTAQRDGLDAQSLAAANRYDATVRGASIAHLLHPARQLGTGLGRALCCWPKPATRSRSVTGAIQAQQQFWLADAALAASVISKPTPPSIP